VGIKSKYQVQINHLVQIEDLPALPQELQADFKDICESVFTVAPYNCLGLPNHALTGDLLGCRALEIDWDGTAYRLVYRVFESPAPRRVLVLSFDEHDPAYDKAKARTVRKRRGEVK